MSHLRPVTQTLAALCAASVCVGAEHQTAPLPVPPAPSAAPARLWSVAEPARGAPATDGATTYFLTASHEVIAVDDLVQVLIPQNRLDVGRAAPLDALELLRAVPDEPARELLARLVHDRDDLAGGELAAHRADARREEALSLIHERRARAGVDDERAGRARGEGDPLLAAARRVSCGRKSVPRSPPMKTAWRTSGRLPGATTAGTPLRPATRSSEGMRLCVLAGARPAAMRNSHQEQRGQPRRR